MNEFDDLIECIERDDFFNFLRCYLEHRERGVKLEFPTSRDFMACREEWELIVGRFSGQPTQDFLNRLNRQWLTLLKQFKGKIDSDFAKNLLDLLSRQPGVVRSSKPKQSRMTISSRLDEIPMDGKKPIESEVASDISEGYYQVEEVRKRKLLSKADVVSHIRQSITRNKPDDFLLYYLMYCLADKKVSVPYSSLPETISKRWSEIILERFSVNPGKGFLKGVSQRWFRLVNEWGFPTDLKKTFELYEKLAARSVGSHTVAEKQASVPAPSPKPRKRNGFLELLKALFT